MADSALGNYYEALKYTKKFQEISNDLIGGEDKKELRDLELKYETEKKNNQIELLKQKNALSEVESSKQAQFSTMLLIISLLLLVLLAIILNRFRLKQKSLKIIQEKSDENEVLVKEIHHRVKNNLQIMLSLLNAQTGLLDDPKSKSLILESQNRIKSMALIHNSLYESGNMVMVQAQNYFNELVHNVLDSFTNENSNISLKTDIANEEIRMTIAVPLGLIVNELVTNSVKYAFDESVNKELNISFSKDIDKGADCYHLRIADNGRGLPEDFSLEKNNSFGLRLVEGITKQLNGSLEISQENGICFDISVDAKKVA